MRKFVIPALGWLVFICCLGRFAAGCGTRWELRGGVPEPLIGADGRYRDGTEPDPVTAYLARTGTHRRAFLILSVLFAALMLWALSLRRACARRQRELEELKQGRAR